LKEQPLFVLALARPDIHDLFCKLWHERDVQEIRLGELPRKACERLVREVLGSAVTEETVGRVAALSAGNAFYLEELIRAVSEGRGDELPETVLTMVEARLSLLPKEARHVLRAGSVFGEFFQQEGVEALLEGALPKAEVKSWISLLTEGEILMTRTDGQLPGNTAFAFRHALLREGAYATLTDADRALGHRLAAVFLERRGDSDPLALAEHFQRGGEAIRAAAHFLRAAKQAARGADSTAAITFARRGLVPGVSPDVRQDLLGVLCEMHAWRAEPAEAWSSADEVMLLSVPGSALWATAAMAKLGSADLHVEGYQETLDALLAVDPAKEAVAVVAYALVVAIFVLDLGGHFELAGAALQRLHAIVLPVAEVDVLARAWMRGPHGYRDTWLNEDPWSGLRESEGAVADFNAIGHLRMARVSQVFVGMNLWFLGDHPGAERELRSAALASTEAELGVAAPLRTFCLVGVLADQGALTEARTEATCALEDRGAQGRGGVRESCARWALAEVLRRTGDLEAAEREALTALVGLSGIPIYHAAATSTLAAIRLAQGNIAMALADAERAMSRYNALGAFGFRGSFARLVHAEALRRAGFQEQARAALSDAQGRLLSVAARMGGGDLARSRSFLENVPENARTLAPLDHARDWCVGRADGAH
jgi:tetratricopeptide (TPR) repeat protein